MEHFSGEVGKQKHNVQKPKSGGCRLLNFIRLRMPSWTGSCKRPSYQLVNSYKTRGIGKQRWWPLFLQGSVGIFLWTCARWQPRRV